MKEVNTANDSQTIVELQGSTGKKIANSEWIDLPCFDVYKRITRVLGVMSRGGIASHIDMLEQSVLGNV